MKKVLYCLVSMLMAVVAFTSCSDTETYAEQKEYENGRIGDFIAKNKIKVISEDQFRSQGYNTNVAENEYVLISSKGIYMQIVEKGTGTILKNGEVDNILIRFEEWNINGDSLQLRNDSVFAKSSWIDNMTITNNSGTFTATFNYGLMPTTYGSSQVPGGWLVPFTYIKPGRIDSKDAKDAIVKLIVPHDQGQAFATNSVYACHYKLTMRRGNQ